MPASSRRLYTTECVAESVEGRGRRARDRRGGHRGDGPDARWQTRRA